MRALLICACLLLTACLADADERFDAGYNDGYAVGYNTECKIRATMVEGDFDNKHYARGYATGELDGINACRATK